jgi:hypothetical protein
VVGDNQTDLAVEKCEHLPQFVHIAGWNAFRVAFQVEPLQPLMEEVPYFRMDDRTSCGHLLRGRHSEPDCYAQPELDLTFRIDPAEREICDVNLEDYH